MEFRSVFIANPAKLSIRNSQLIVEKEESVSIPVEDIGCILIETPQVTCSTAVLRALSEAGVSLFVCDEKHMPCGTLLPMNCHSRQLKILKAQLDVTKPVVKQMWKDIVVRKILNQALCLEFANKSGSHELREMAQEVVSGDTANVEAKAAVFYFPALFGNGFVRSMEVIENCALNYGYAILRGIIARNLVVYGLEPCFGIHHHSELNQFNLADDLIEPFRPIVDLLVYSLNLTGERDLTPKRKQALFNTTNLVVTQSNQRFRVNSAIGRCVASFAKSVQENENKIELPTLLPTEEYRYA